MKVSSTATAKKREEQPIEGKRPWGLVKEDLCRIWRETLDHMAIFPLLITFWMVWIPSKFLKNSQDASILWISSAFLWCFNLFVLIYSSCWCPMSHVPCGVFVKNVLALPLSIGTCSGLGMLGIALTAWSIKFPWLVFIVVVVVFFLSLLHLHCWFWICCWEGRGGY